MPNALILLGHPRLDSFNHALAEAYAHGFRKGSGRVQCVQLTSLSFDPILRDKDQALEPDLLTLRQSIERAQHLVWIFPLYWGTTPAVVRGVIDRTFLPGWAYQHQKGKQLPDGLLAGRSARIISTMDSPWFWYWFGYRGSIHAQMGTGTMAYCGVRPTKYTTVYSVRRLSTKARDRWQLKMQQLGAADCEKLTG